MWDIEIVLDPTMAPNTLSARVEGEMLQIRVAPGVKAMTLAVLHEPIAAAVAEAIDDEMSALLSVTDRQPLFAGNDSRLWAGGLPRRPQQYIGALVSRLN